MAEDTLTAVLKLRDDLSEALSRPIGKLNLLRSTVDTVGGAFVKASLVIKGVALLLGRSVIQTADHLDRLSKQTGVSTTALQKLQYAGIDAGVSIDQLGLGIRALERHAQGALRGNKDMIEAFKAIGISVSDLTGPDGKLKKGEELFYLLANALKGFSEEARQEAGFKILGGRAHQLLPLLGLGADEIKRLGLEAQDMGAVMSEDAVRGLDAFGDGLTKLTQAIKGQYGEWLATQGDALPKIITGIEQFVFVINELKERAVIGFQLIGATVTAVGRVFAGVFPAMAETAGIAVAKVIVNLQSMARAIGAIMAALGIETGNRLIEWANSLGDMGELAKKSLLAPWRDLDKDVQEPFDKAVDAAEKAYASLPERMRQTNAEIHAIFENLRNAISKKMVSGTKADDSKLPPTKEHTERLRDFMRLLQKFQEQTGISFDQVQIDKWSAALDNGSMKLADISEQLDKIKKKTEKDPLGGLKMALHDFSKEVETNFKDVFLAGFNDIRGAFSDSLALMLENADNWKDGMKGILDNLKHSFIKMFTDIITNKIFGQLLGAFGLGGGAGGAGGIAGAAAGMAGAGAGALGGAAGGGGFVSPFTIAPAQQGGGGFLQGLAGALPALGIGVGGGLLMNAAGGGGGALGGPVGGAVGGGLAGAGIGSIFGPIGIGIGALIGGVGGGFMGKEGEKDAEKEKEQQEQQAEEAAAKLAAQYEQAKGVIEQSVKVKLGGGLATTEAADAAGALLSGGISNQEVDAFGGPKAVLGQQAMIEGLAANKQITNNTPITVNATIGGTYDVAQLAQDLGYYVQQNIASAAAGAGP